MEEVILDYEFGHGHDVVVEAVEGEPWEAEFFGGVERPPEEGVGDQEADTWK